MSRTREVDLKMLEAWQ